MLHCFEALIIRNCPPPHYHCRPPPTQGKNKWLYNKLLKIFNERIKNTVEREVRKTVDKSIGVSCGPHTDCWHSHGLAVLTKQFISCVWQLCSNRRSATWPQC